MTLCIGEIVRTSYNTGPYRIVRATGPHTSPSYLDSINGIDRPSEPHFSLVCHDADPAPGRKNSESYLNGYRLDGTSVWNDDFLIFQSVSEGAQLNLWATYDFRARENGLTNVQQLIVYKVQEGGILRLEAATGRFILKAGRDPYPVAARHIDALLAHGYLVGSLAGTYHLTPKGERLP